MASDGVDYAAVIADLESKILTLQGMVASLKAIASGALGNLSGIPTGGGTFKSLDNGQAFELPKGALLGKSLPEAIKLYLGAVKEKQTNKQIAAALREGGVESTGANFESIVTGAIHRLKVANEVLRFKDGWGLAEHYPESLRSRILDQKTNGKKSKKRSAKKLMKARSKEGPQTSKAKKAEVLPKVQTEGKIPAVKVTETTQSIERVTQDIILAKPTHTFQAAEIAKLLNRKVQVAALLLGKLAHRGIIQKLETGGYQAIKQLQSH